MRREVFTKKEEHRDIPIIKHILFSGKQNILWKDVEQYLKRYIGNSVIVKEYQDSIEIGSDFPDEYSASNYTKSLRGATAKAKANAAQIIEEIISTATNKRWSENKKEKHKQDARKGWYRYDASFGIVVQGSNEGNARLNQYHHATLVIRNGPTGLFLYDMINIKKKRVSRLSQIDYTVENRFLSH